MARNSFINELNVRRARTEMIQEAVRVFEQNNPSYAFQAGYYLSRMMTLAADREDTTLELVRELKRIGAK